MLSVFNSQQTLEAATFLSLCVSCIFFILSCFLNVTLFRILPVLFLTYFTLLLSSPFQRLNSCDRPSFEQGNAQGQQLSEGHWSRLCSSVCRIAENYTAIKTVTVFLCRNIYIYMVHRAGGVYYGCWGIIWGRRCNRVCGYVPCLEMSSECRSHRRGQQSGNSRKRSRWGKHFLSVGHLCAAWNHRYLPSAVINTSKSIMGVILQQRGSRCHCRHPDFIPTTSGVHGGRAGGAVDPPGGPIVEKRVLKCTPGSQNVS